MLQSYVLSSILTLSLTFTISEFLHLKARSNLSQTVPDYMWDIYSNGLNSSEADVVRSLQPKFTGFSFRYRNHRRKLLEFIVPKRKKDEVVIEAEVRITTKQPTTSFQIYTKTDKWIFLDEKKVSGVGTTWVSLRIGGEKSRIFQPGPVTFLIVTFFPNWSGDVREVDFFQPVLLLSYCSRSSGRRKRSLGSENYEEKTNRISGRGEEAHDGEATVGGRSSCRRKSLYVKFSDIDFDSWIVAPSGYDAFQCTGKCNFPVGEHLSPTKHAILQTLLHNIRPWRTSRACCVPTKLDPISILYIDENGILTYRFRYQEMVVAECGCR